MVNRAVLNYWTIPLRNLKMNKKTIDYETNKMVRSEI